MPKLAVAMLIHEGNSFSPLRTGIAGFEAAVWCEGDEAAEAFAGTSSEIGGVLRFLSARPAWEGRFLRLAHAMPGGPLESDLFDSIREEIVAGLIRERFDAVYLALHGALMVDGRDLAELELVSRVREAIGPDILLGLSFDMHANLDPRIVAHVNFASGYKTHPHIDQAETAERVLAGLERTLSGDIAPVGAIAKTSTILPSINMRTDSGPMAELEAVAAAMIRGPVLEAVPFGGFCYADTAAAGASAMVFVDRDAELAQRSAGRLRDAIEERRDAFFVALPDADEAVAEALAVIKAGRGPAAVVDAADNPLSGGILDTPGLLRAVLQAEPGVPTLVVLFCDPYLVAAAEAAGVGATLSGTLGGRLSDQFGAPVPIRAVVRALAPGRFEARPPLVCGPRIDFGQLALLQIDGTQVQVVVSSVAASPHDPGLLETLAIDVGSIALFCIKAKNHFRAAYEARFPTIIPCDAPGPAALDVARFPFERAPAHLYPLSARPAALDCRRNEAR